ncbi:hypothetical protein SLS58_003826 [Diplodia intermedia]|uniref:Uncharacterized protein n=1 Tax=Diplodia intermedia TaxID=856260 RepID=A0ABR3TVI6_9PEZI
MAHDSMVSHIINFKPEDVEELETANRYGRYKNITGLSVLVLSICCQVPCGRVNSITRVEIMMERLHGCGILEESLDDILDAGGFLPEQLVQVAYHLRINLGIWETGSALAYSEVQDISLPTVLVKYHGGRRWTGLRRKDAEEASALDVCPTASVSPHSKEYDHILRLVATLEIPAQFTELVPYWRDDLRRRWYRPLDQFALLWDRWIASLPEDQRAHQANLRATDYHEQKARRHAFFLMEIADYQASVAVTKPFSRFGAITAEQQAELQVKKSSSVFEDTQVFPAAQRRCIRQWLRLLGIKHGWEFKSYFNSLDVCLCTLEKDGAEKYTINISDEKCEWRHFKQASNPPTLYLFKKLARDLGAADKESEVFQMWDILPGFFDGAHDGAVETFLLYTLRSAMERYRYPKTEVLLSSASPWALDINISMKAFGDRMKHDLFVNRIE